MAEELKSLEIDRPTLNDVLGGAFEAHRAGGYHAVIDHIDAFAGASRDFRRRITNEVGVETGAERLSRAMSIAAALLRENLNLGFLTQLFLLLANAVGEFPETAEIDDATATAEIRRYTDGWMAWERLQMAFFAAVALRRSSLFEKFVPEILDAPDVSLETRLALASGITILYQTMRKANQPLGYEGISPGLIAAYYRPYRDRLQFVGEIVNRVGSELAAELAKHDLIRHRPLRPPRLKICFLLDDLGHRPLNTTTKLIIDYAYLLVAKMANLSVDILVAKNHWPNDEYRMLGVHSNAYASLEDLLHAYGFEDGPLREGRLTLGYLDAPTHGGYVQRFVDALIRIQPDCVVLFPVPGFVLEQALYENFPLVAVELLNGMCPSRRVDAYIPNGRPGRDTIAQYGDKLVLMPLPSVPFVAREHHTRESLGYPERGAGVVIASVGINFERRMRGLPDHNAYWEGVAQTLRAYPHAIWQLVGINTDGEASIVSQCPQLREHVDSGRLRFRQYETDLRAFLQCCDIYASPPIPGAGRGAELAACCALPILGYPYNDAANFLPENQVHGSHQEYFAALDRLIENPALRDEFGAANSRILGEDYFSYAAQGLLYAALKAIDRYNERQGLGIKPRDD